MGKGVHIILDCSDVPKAVCMDDKNLLKTVCQAAEYGGATIINSLRYRFGDETPPGCTVFVMMDESHISVHTYAEDGKMAIDAFSCGRSSARRMVDYLNSKLQLTNCFETVLERL